MRFSLWAVLLLVAAACMTAPPPLLPASAYSFRNEMGLRHAIDGQLHQRQSSAVPPGIRQAAARAAAATLARRPAVKVALHLRSLFDGATTGLTDSTCICDASRAPAALAARACLLPQERPGACPSSPRDPPLFPSHRT